MSWIASSAISHCAFTTKASSASDPITAWFVRGARESMTAVSSYG